MPGVIWTSEDDWRNARAESGVIHRAFGDRVGTEIAMGTDLLPQGPVDWFGMGTSGPLVPIMSESAVYDATANKTFVVWLGRLTRAYITYYDHALGVWGPNVEISTFKLTDDDHGAPSICQDASGYLHVFFGTHNNAAKYSISTSPRDISAWTAQTDVAGNWTYQQPFVIGGNIWLIGRENPSLGTTYNLTVVRSNGVATGHTWQSLIPLYSPTGKMAYPSDYWVVGDDIHVTWWRRDNLSDTNGRHIYYAVYETDTGLFKTAAGTTHGALPISEATADANYRVFDSGTQDTNAPTLWLDSGGLPHIAFIHNNGTTIDLYHTRWNGSAWTTPVSLATGARLWGNPAAIVASDTSADLYWKHSDAVTIRKTTFNPSNDTSVSTATWLTNSDWAPNGVRDLGAPIAHRNAHADLRLLVSEERNEVWWYEHLRVAAYGDSGFLQAPAWRQDALLALPFNEDAGATTLVDYGGHGQNVTNNGVVMGVAGLMGLTGAQFASGREADVPHAGVQWLFAEPCVIRFWGVNLVGAIVAKGRPANSDLRYAIRVLSDRLRVTNKVDASFLSADSTTGLTTSGPQLFEVSWDGAGTLSFFKSGSAVGTSTAISLAKFTAKTPTTALHIGYFYSSGSNAATKEHATGVGQGLVMIPRYQSTLAEHQAFWNTLTAGSFTSAWRLAT